MSKPSVKFIDELLPQTQCGLCTYGACLPYAQALVDEEAPINLCPPGGVETLKQLGKHLQKDPTPFIAEMEKNTKLRTRAVIREDECIGCTKCIQACPVDAIIGAGKQMHTVIADACTGCDLCLEPCPVDCIDMVAVTDFDQIRQANAARKNYNARQLRLARNKTQKNKQEKTNLPDQSVLARQQFILDAVARAKAKRADRSA